ncbi:DnaB-like helicase C-terminal domain-containing protein [Pseudogemmobacter sonorensis]|uniref:DnaB-like helicase C-terminal domain-containing protein n=1 Tax=Pseudogemmobacter sonorensis TaxID=2989681 RepID=UPI003693B434
MNAVAKIQDAPQMVEAEQIVLGMLMLHNADRIGDVIKAGGQDLFFDPVHARIFDVIASKARSDELVSPVTIKAAMSADEGLADLGGPAYLVRCAGAAPQATHMPHYVGILRDLHHKRRLGSIMADAQAAIARGDEPAAHIAAKIETQLIEMAPSEGQGGPVSMYLAVAGALAQASAAFRGEDTHAVRSGITALDRIVSGFYPGELILIGGRPSMGKTGVALSLALNAARAGQGVCIASLEMNPEAMALRALSEQTAQQRFAVAYSSIRRGEMNQDHVDSLMAASKEVEKLPIMFLSRQFSDIGAMVAGAKQVQRAMNGNLRLLVIDYAQLLKADGRTRYEQITNISMALKSLAGQLNIPVIALSQLSRAVEQREDKRPVMADLRESGQLEQDADTVLFCYRDEYYVEREKPSDVDDIEAMGLWEAAMEKARNRLEIIVAKQRQGEIGTAKVRFNPAINLIWEDGER